MSSNNGNLKQKKEFLISEIHRFIKENEREPIALDMAIMRGFPSQREFIKAFGSWAKAKESAGCVVFKPERSKKRKCPFCGEEFEPFSGRQKICQSKKCRFVRDRMLTAKYQKKKHAFSIFHYMNETQMVDYFKNLYDVKNNEKGIGMV